MVEQAETAPFHFWFQVSLAITIIKVKHIKAYKTFAAFSENGLAYGCKPLVT